MRDLRDNNNKEWFEANKATFTEQVQEPALSLVVALGERLEAAYPAIRYSTHKSSGTLMRIYRDTRFSKDQNPYKTNVAMMFVPAGQKRMNAPGFGLQMTLDEVNLVAGQFGFDKDQLTVYREAVASDKGGRELVAAIEQVQAAGDYTLSNPDLKRVPRGYEADHPRADLLKHKGLAVYAPSISLEVVQTPELVDVVMGHYTNMAPVWQWLMETFDG